MTSRWWTAAPDLSAEADADRGRRVVRLGGGRRGRHLGQLVVGAIMRHYRAGLAIPDFPLATARSCRRRVGAALDRVQPTGLATCETSWRAFTLGAGLAAVRPPGRGDRRLGRGPEPVGPRRAPRRRPLDADRPAWLLLGLLLAQVTLGRPDGPAPQAGGRRQRPRGGRGADADDDVRAGRPGRAALPAAACRRRVTDARALKCCRRNPVRRRSPFDRPGAEELSLSLRTAAVSADALRGPGVRRVR